MCEGRDDVGGGGCASGGDGAAAAGTEVDGGGTRDAAGPAAIRVAYIMTRGGTVFIMTKTYYVRLEVHCLLSLLLLFIFLLTPDHL